MTSVSCASSVSGPKFSPQSQADHRSKSCDTSCASNSSCFFKRRKPMNPLAYSMRPTYCKTGNTVKQRVMSARLLKLRQVQSQLNDANFHLAEVARENQILKTLQKRQDKALSKYENTNADLPRLIRSHEEEIRVLSERNKSLKKNVRDLTEQLKLKEEELVRVRDQLSHLEKLNKDKHLTEREKLMDQMEEYKMKLQKNEELVATLNRKLMLEGKISKQRLNTEALKHKQSQRELLHALEEIDRLTGLLDAKENLVRPRNLRFNKLKMAPQAPVTDVRLEPISNGSNRHLKKQSGFQAPMENIRQRLSSGSIKIPEDLNSTGTSVESRESSADYFKLRPSSSLKLEKLPCVDKNQDVRSKKTLVQRKEAEGDISSDGETYVEDREVLIKYDYEAGEEIIPGREQISDQEDPELQSSTNNENIMPEEDLLGMINKMKQDKRQEERLLDKNRSADGNNSQEISQPERDIEQMARTLDSAIQKAADNSEEVFHKYLGNYCSDVLGSVKECNKAIEDHKISLENYKQDTDILLDTFRETKKIEKKLKKSFFSATSEDMDFVREILNEENKFQMENKMPRPNEKVQSNTEKNPLVTVESKKKLLATLRAIDNGDSVESIEDSSKSKVMSEIFSRVAH